MDVDLNPQLLLNKLKHTCVFYFTIYYILFSGASVTHRAGRLAPDEVLSQDWSALSPAFRPFWVFSPLSVCFLWPK